MSRIFCLLVISLLSLPVKAETAESYHLGIFPYMAPRQTVELFGPVAANLEALLKHPVKMESAATFPDFSQNLINQIYDIALIQPFDYTAAVERYGYIPIAKLDAPLITQLIVREDSLIKNIKDLKGTTIALPPEQSANARMMLHALQDNKLIPGRDIKVKFFNSHDSCLQQVWIGEASACGTSKSPLLVFEQRMHAKLRSIFNTPAIPHTLFVVNPRVPVDDRVKLQEIITGWNKTDDGRMLMKKLGFPGFVSIKKNEYTVMRKYDQITSGQKSSNIEKRDLIFGIFPFLNARQLATNFAPLLPALSKAIGMTIHLQTAKNYVSFNQALNSKTFDIVAIQPFNFTEASNQGYLPLVGTVDPLRGEFYVVDTSPYQKISDLKGTVIAMSDSTAALSRLGRFALKQAGLDTNKDVTIDYRINHDSCLQQVHSNSAAACVTSNLTLSMVPEEISQHLRSIGQTISIPGPLLMVHNRIPSKTRQQLLQEILSWKNNEHGLMIIKSIGFGALTEVNTADYLSMPKL